MASKRARAENNALNDGPSLDRTAASTSQGDGEQSLERLMENMFNASRNRQANKRTEAGRQRTAVLAQGRSDLTALQDHHRQQVEDARRAHLDNIDKLLVRKMAAVSSVLVNLQTIENRLHAESHTHAEASRAKAKSLVT